MDEVVVDIGLNYTTKVFMAHPDITVNINHVLLVVLIRNTKDVQT